jgi:hypothetical protein
VCRKRERGRRSEVRDYPNEVSRVCPLGRELGHPYIKSGGQVTYRERGSPDRVVVSLREGKLVNLVCKKGHFVLASAYVRIWLSLWS